MPSDIENQVFDLLTTTVEDEKKNVTYRWLSRSMGLSVNTSKKLMELYLTTVGEGNVHGTYYLARRDPQTGNQSITLVSQEDLNEAKKDSTVIGYHIYSLEPSPLKDLAILSVANSEAGQLQKGKDINIYRVIHNKDAVASKHHVRSTATPGAISAATVKASSVTSKQSAAATSAPSSTAEAATITVTTSNSSKAKPAAKSSMMSFFGKAATAPAKTAATSAKPTATATAPAATVAKSSTLNFKPSQQQKRKADSMSSGVDNVGRSGPATDEGSDEEVDSEEERDRRLALSSRLDQDQGDVVTNSGKEPVIDIEAYKKKQRSARLLAVDDDDEVVEEEEEEEEKEDSAKHEDKDAHHLALENMMIDTNNVAEVEDEDSVMVDVEALDPPKTPNNGHGGETVASQGAVKRRVRGYRTVTKKKTFKNERGYIVTQDVVEMEPFSEDEIVPVEAPAPTPMPTRAGKATEPVKGKIEVGKKKAGSGNQSLLNFFSKK
ncbi:DNA polymerase subunit Cdc27 [Gamsiella multidivaricata]|uniref:DNA polymerase subunit Cdc27 n=1 Tax=Gamsiella multidivaricata TaxID=101098 RepID=UPI00221F52CC|nr:DNA polymerase subunit Cdc27 [Gamsiella multidivaricata]KAG0353644.1 DNA polymerase delta subunit 3 [Gamsiella multidivaricata]KAI7830276.1 DNA polymerase subunit Cdc27 [Gamsiella multidivaricata]